MNFPLLGDSYRKQNAYAEVLKPSALDVPDMRVKINPGWLLVNGTNYIQYSGGYSPLIAAPNSTSKIVLIYLSQYGVVTNVDGDTSADPEAPDLPKGGVPLALVKVLSTSTVINNTMISDARPLFVVNNFPTLHSELEDLDESDSHPIAAITGLTSALSDLVGSTALTELLEAKADDDGTTSNIFTINSDKTGTPSEDCSLLIERGDEATVGFKWDESANRLKLTEDGTNWANICRTTGTDELTFTLQNGLTGAPSSNCSLIVNRGSSDDVLIRWNETSDIFEFTNDGTLYNPIPTAVAMAAKANLVGSADIEITDDAKGLILTASDDSRHRILVSTAGVLSTEVVT